MNNQTDEHHKLLNLSNKIIIVSGNEALLVKDVNHGKYSLPGGRMDEGEDIETAFIREVLEETSINISDLFEKLEFVNVINDNNVYNDERKNIGVVYLISKLEFNKKPEIKLSPEHTDYKWVTLENIHKYQINRKGYKDAVIKVLSEIESEIEKVDILDEGNFDKIRVTTKSNAHETGELHPCVLAVVKRTDGTYSLTINAMHRQDPGKVVPSIGGHVSAGETADEAVRRETFEELGISETEVSEYKFIGDFVYNREVLDRKENHYFHFFEIITDSELELNHESMGYKNYSTEEFKAAIHNTPDDFAELMKIVINKFYK